jgi:hypothetical protein
MFWPGMYRFALAGEAMSDRVTLDDAKRIVARMAERMRLRGAA